MAIEATSCTDCPLRFDSHMSSDSFCRGTSKRGLSGRELPESAKRDDNPKAPEWCPADGGIVVILKRKAVRRG